MKVSALVVIALCYAVLSCEMAQAQNLNVFPSTLRVEMAPLEVEGAARVGQQLQIRFETANLRGSAWRLWLETVAPLQSLGRALPAQVLSWEAREPFISGTLLPNERVLVGEGPIDGRPVRGQLVWFVRGELPGSGDYVGRLQLVLEELP